MAKSIRSGVTRGGSYMDPRSYGKVEFWQCELCLEFFSDKEKCARHEKRHAIVTGGGPTGQLGAWRLHKGPAHGKLTVTKHRLIGRRRGVGK